MFNGIGVEGAMSAQAHNFLEQDSAGGRNAEDVVRYLKHAIISGTHWYIALLTAIGMWNVTEEDYAGKHYRYIVGGDAFNYFLLVKRLCHTIYKMIPQGERESLLLLGKPPLELDMRQVHELLGNTRYQAYLNYLYGVVVENALMQYVEDEIRKEQHAAAFHKRSNISEEAYRRIYGTGKAELQERFVLEAGSKLVNPSAAQLDEEFTYWRFKYRLKYCNKEKVASDTRKGLKKLHNYPPTQLTVYESPSDKSPVIDSGLDWR